MRPFLLAFLIGCPSSPAPAPATDPSTETGDTDTDTDVPPTPEPAAWSFTPIDGMVCGAGTPTGVGISEGTDDAELMLFFAGGGACWDLASCYVLESAVHIQGTWDAADLEAETNLLAASGLADRSTDMAYADATWVYVPYCTGDLQIGSEVRQYDPVFNPNRYTHHVGDDNLTLLLAHLVAERPNLERIWLVGLSAGGYAVQLQAHRFRDTWPTADLSVYADGSPMIQPGEYRWSAWRGAWNPELPSDCVDCEARLPALFAHRVQQTPDVDYALDVTSNDTVITLFFAQPLGGLGPPLDAMAHDLYLDSDQLSVFRVDVEGHTLLEVANSVSTSEGVLLRDWFADWAAGEPLSDTR